MRTVASPHEPSLQSQHRRVFKWGHRVSIGVLAALLVALLRAPAGLAVAHNAPVPTPDLAAIDRYVEDQMHEQAIPGLALGIVRGDQLVALRGYGVAGPDGVPVTPQTPFMVGSVSKSFTALAVMQLVESGKLDLDAPVQQYLPWFTLADPAAAAHITPHLLLTQTSGIGRTGDYDKTHEDRREMALEESVRRLSAVVPNRAPGSTFEYANANYIILGLLVQVVSGRPSGLVQSHWRNR